ncbi:dTDP-4-amino-4,6-dideoxy-D-glucose transaminase [Pseudidiomarina piscicola]|uniref:dTDP-4-amino-4,6-dideoxy-D-glucose transaminase n=1 Tax=Pseudidiomarina piscicola TaxID=2614830 RepID=A0A6S6WMY9_9GAMM|nr:DegT/DnrJ/EryC1/StrS family aminotransferase [Pseudidiomarina piscicola]CAB0151205.1 dTDP-4-amino-4,6-dideoxy-D-glucose transaminase [Pseudidiomarina piscicola]VZT40711.1 dTDP-4-amino-4,6-dideoxy-D-glucose transaminase [Pseudomonas aeruginosa]
MIPVTKPYLPSREKLDKYIDGIYGRNWLTNNGPLVQELTRRLEEYLGVENLLLVSNGTLALQIAYRALEINEPVNGRSAEAITTPFTFVATSSSLKWEGIEPVFADIGSDTWCLDPNNIKPAITSQTKAIIPVHVFGNACDVEAIEGIANENNLKVIYDAAHAFGVQYKGESLLKWGDAATLSFHATKVFHTIEGGAIVFKRKKDFEKAKLLISFGITGAETIEGIGINAKMNEFQAAMGLCCLDEIESILSSRLRIIEQYKEKLDGLVTFPVWKPQTSQNGAYQPILLDSQETCVEVISNLTKQKIFSRRYFSPSLDELEEISIEHISQTSRDISKRILCLPLYSELSNSDVELICSIIQITLNTKGNL